MIKTCTTERAPGDIVRGYPSREQPMPEAETGQAVHVLDLLLEYFGEQGERWTRDRYDDGDGRRCLVGALHYFALPAPHLERERGVFSTRGNEAGPSL